MFAVGLCIDAAYLLPALTTLASLADSLRPLERQNVALRVLTHDLSPEHVAIMDAFSRRLGFNSFDLQWRHPPAGSYIIEGASYITTTTYLRFQFRSRFVQRPYVVYLDADALVLGDISTPFASLEDGQLGAVRDEFNSTVGDCPALPGLVQRWPKLRGHPYYNAGALWLPTRMMPTIRAGVAEAMTRGRRYIHFNDQDALNLWLPTSSLGTPVAERLNRFELGRFLEKGDWVRRVVQRICTRSRQPSSISSDHSSHGCGPARGPKAYGSIGGICGMRPACCTAWVAGTSEQSTETAASLVRPSVLDRSVVTAACRQLLATEMVEIARLSRAPASSSYRVRLSDRRFVIVKLYFGNSLWKAVHERRVIETLSRTTAKVRTAAVVGSGRIDRSDAAALITTDLGARTLWRAVEEGEYTYDEALRLLGDLLAAFHDVDVACARVGDKQHRSDPPLQRQVRQELGVLCDDRFSGFAARVEPALRRLAGLCRPPSVEVGCHGDLHPANVVLCPLENGILAPHLVDFEATVRCPPEYDLAKSIVTTSALGDHDQRTLLDGYGRAVSEELLSALIVFHAVAGWIYAATIEGRDRALWRNRLDTVLARHTPLFS